MRLFGNMLLEELLSACHLLGNEPRNRPVIEALPPISDLIFLPCVAKPIGWCTYGTCPNCSYLIGQDGTVASVNTWFNDTDLKRDIDLLLAP
ncbi:MAG: hypothetical protein GY811_09050 [Myxococcales bacterium]|nr:hypothetical protein [Myxococcales bacterium]